MYLLRLTCAVVRDSASASASLAAGERRGPVYLFYRGQIK